MQEKRWSFTSAVGDLIKSLPPDNIHNVLIILNCYQRYCDFLEQNYDPFLVSFVKLLQPEQQAAVDAHHSFSRSSSSLAKSAVG